MSFAEKNDLVVIEDAAQAFGAEDGKGRRAGSFGHLACFSFNSMKVFHSYGEAGAVLTDDEELVGRESNPFAMRVRATVKIATIQV